MAHQRNRHGHPAKIFHAGDVHWFFLYAPLCPHVIRDGALKLRAEGTLDAEPPPLCGPSQPSCISIPPGHHLCMGALPNSFVSVIQNQDSNAVGPPEIVQSAWAIKTCCFWPVLIHPSGAQQCNLMGYKYCSQQSWRKAEGFGRQRGCQMLCATPWGYSDKLLALLLLLWNAWCAVTLSEGTELCIQVYWQAIQGLHVGSWGERQEVNQGH